MKEYTQNKKLCMHVTYAIMYTHLNAAITHMSGDICELFAQFVATLMCEAIHYVIKYKVHQYRLRFLACE